MAVVTLEDLQGTLEVVVFPKTYEETIGTWRDGAILLVAGRVDHRGEEASLLADSVWDWDAVAERGPEAFAREVGVAGQARRRGGRAGGGRERRQRHGTATAAAERPAAGSGTAVPGAGRARPGRSPRPAIRRERRSPAGRRRPAARRARRADRRPTPSRPDLASAAGAGGAGAPRSRRSPTRQRTSPSAAAQAPSRPSRRSPGAVLNVRFARERRARSASCRRCRRSRPCSASGRAATRVVVHVPAPGGAALPMELRGVAYDAELVAEVRRRVGDGVIDLSLG